MSTIKKYESLLLESKLASPGLVSGTFFLHPRGCFIWEQIQSFLNAEFSKLGVSNVLFPALLPFQKFQEEQKNSETLNLEEIMRLHNSKSEQSVVALRPTSEILFSHYFKERLKERDIKLPFLLNQWSSVYREERNTKLFFRSKEFYWQELHSLHENQKDLDFHLEKIHEIYKKLLRELLCIEYITGEKTILERFPGAQKTLTNECILPDGQSLQLTTTHDLSNFFSKLMDIKYWGANDIEMTPLQLSAGSSTRLIGALVEMHKDSVGVILPWNLSKENIAILLLGENRDEETISYISSIREKLCNYRLHIDDSYSSFGKKINKVERLGIPVSLIIGQQEIKNKKITIKSRLSESKYECDLSNLENEISRFSKEYDQKLRERSENKKLSLIKESYKMEELVQLVKEGNLALSPWFNDLENEQNFQECKYNFSPRCIKEKIKDKDLYCVFSGKKANCLAYFGRSY
ncbi:aminoacyl--tRNA ligase-related protein [Mycoplasma suis]|uniref:Proline--tRNA ligase n=1 Tax=Mycoplasma suis (strain Illinois) TaxID=768700 RepID=F0QPZ2_MYCSL|nr:aminoacyl--tRNA ligase-related protein [Mycoplasma suis]ADX97562.1 prolyl-tRNA synthetase [Mycoplasma suis str. Illinois]